MALLLPDVKLTSRTVNSVESSRGGGGEEESVLGEEMLEKVELPKTEAETGRGTDTVELVEGRELMVAEAASDILKSEHD